MSGTESETITGWIKSNAGSCVHFASVQRLEGKYFGETLCGRNPNMAWRKAALPVNGNEKQCDLCLKRFNLVIGALHKIKKNNPPNQQPQITYERI